MSYAICGDRIVWDCWLGLTTKTDMPEQVDGGLATALDAVNACRRHAKVAA